MTKSTERSEHRVAKPKTGVALPESSAVAPHAADEATLLGDLRGLVLSARQRIATAAYSTQTLLCWHRGRRLGREHLHGGRAAYGKPILVTVSRELTADCGRGFSHAEVAGMIRLAQAFPTRRLS